MFGQINSQNLDLNLLAMKIKVPPVRHDLVMRPLLLRQLNKSLSYPFILVVAPAGFGKTTLLSQWLEQVSLPAVWISLEKADNDPVRFWHYLIAGLSQVHPEIGQKTIDLLRSNFQVSPKSLIVSIINEVVSFSSEFILVLDDYHMITETSIDDAIDYLLEYLPINMHVVVATRSDPAFFLHRLRAYQKVKEFRKEDLRFTGSDFMEFYHKMIQFHLTNDELKILETKTEGWIAGMRLTTLTLDNLEIRPKQITDFSDSDRYMMDYLTEEVLNHQPKKIQNFLLKTSILKRMTGSLCEVVTGEKNAEELIEHLEKSNSFIICLDSNKQWYRYHHMFAQLLQQRLRLQDQHHFNQLHLLTCEWFAKHEHHREAIEHALVGKHYKRAAELILDHAPTMLKKGEILSLHHWLQKFPKKWLEKEPHLNIVYLWVLTLQGKFEHAELQLSHLEKAVNQSLNDDICVEILTIRGYIAILRKDTQLAVQMLSESTKLDPRYSRFLQVGIELNLGEACILRSPLGLKGYLNQVNDLYPQLRTIWKNSGLPIVAYGSVVLGELYYERNEFDHLTYFLKRGIGLAKEYGKISIAVPIYFIYAKMNRVRKDRSAMWVVMNDLDEFVTQLDSSPHWTSIILAFKTKLWMEEQDMEKVRDWVLCCGLKAQDPLTPTREFEYFIFARALYRLGEIEDATFLLNRLLHAAESEDRLGNTIEASILQALHFKHIGNKKRAAAMMKRAIALAEPHGYLRIFLDEGEPVRELLTQVNATVYTEKLLTLFEKEVGSNQLTHVELLTPREVDVIKLIEQGMTNKEIANKLHITIGTVKAYANQLFGKLEVKNRTQAILKAREAGYL